MADCERKGGGCEECQAWCRFLSEMTPPATAQKHENSFRAIAGEAYRLPPPIPDNPCPEVKSYLQLAYREGII